MRGPLERPTVLAGEAGEGEEIGLVELHEPAVLVRRLVAELAAADIYESENYRREQATLASGMRAWVYVKA